MSERFPRIALTPGEPAGIGPDLCIALAREHLAAELVLVADPELLRARAELLGQAVNVLEYEPDRPPRPCEPGNVRVLPVQAGAQPACGRLDPRNAEYVLQTLRSATAECLAGRCDALVTGPVHKGVINDAGIAFQGHTELLAELCERPRAVMMLAVPGLRVVLVTTHLPLTEVSAAITPDRLETTLRITEGDLRERFAIHRPRLLVCGLNPHAGEGGHLGGEELETIEPVLARLRAEGLQLEGPVPADTAFLPERLEQVDAVVTMYHDQGLPVLKAKGFGQAVNVTLGLPLIRTSVDHGTALELACTGRADPRSLQAAFELAVALVRRRQEK